MKNFLRTSLQFLDPRTYFSRRDGVRTRSKLSTMLSVLTHLAIFGSLWAVPAQELPKIEPPEIVVDASVLPAEVEPQPQPEPIADETPPEPSSADEEVQNEPQPKEANSSGQSLTVDNNSGVQKISTGNSGKVDGNGNSKGKDKVESEGGGKKKEKESVAPTNTNNKSSNDTNTPAVGKPRDFDVKFVAEISKKTVQKSRRFQEEIDQNSSGDNASGSANLTVHFDANGSYESYLSANASAAIAKAKLTARGKGAWKNGKLMTKEFVNDYSVQAPLGIYSKDKRTTVTVDHDKKTAIFMNGGESNSSTFSQDSISDFMSAIAEIKIGLSNGTYKPNQSTSIPIVKRKNIENASITFSEPTPVDTPKGAVNAIMTDIKIDSGSLDLIRIWYNQADDYTPVKMEIHTKSPNVIVVLRAT